MGRRKTTISENALEMIVSINQRLTDLVNCDIPKRLHCIEEKLDYINPKLLTIEHIDRFYSEVKTVLTVAASVDSPRTSAAAPALSKNHICIN